MYRRKRKGISRHINRETTADSKFRSNARFKNSPWSARSSSSPQPLPFCIRQTKKRRQYAKEAAPTSVCPWQASKKVLETQAHPRLKPLLNPSQSATFSLILSSQRSKIQIRETEVVLMNFLSKTCSFFCLLAFLSTTIFTPAAHAEKNQVFGEIELVG